MLGLLDRTSKEGQVDRSVSILMGGRLWVVVLLLLLWAARRLAAGPPG